MIVSQPLFFSGYEIAPSFLNHFCFCLRFLRFHLFFGGFVHLRPTKTAPASGGVKTHSEAEVTTGGRFNRALLFWWVLGHFSM